jgi:hypothetical protein
MINSISHAKNTSLSILTFLILLSSCSPRDFLTRRLAFDLIAASNTFTTPQQLQFRTGIVSNKDYLSPDYLALQHHGWISATKANCLPSVEAPCLDVTLTPAGVDTLQGLVAPGETEKQFFTIPAAKRELIAVTGISKQANVASIEFTWRWTPLNEVGAALYPSDQRYRSYAAFRLYDDGWRVITGAGHPGQPLEDALKNGEPSQ